MEVKCNLQLFEKLIIFLFVVESDIKAHDGIWILGDMQLNDSHGNLIALCNTRILEKKKQLHLFERFNIKTYYPSLMPATRNPFARMFNQLVKALNQKKNHLLPKIIMILPEKNMIEHIDFFGFRISSILDTTIGWLVNKVNREIDSHFQKLAEAKLGSVKAGEPRVIWLKIYNQPHRNQSLSLRNKFNAILEERLSRIRGNFIMDIDAGLAKQYEYFDRLGNINDYGKMQFWKTLMHN